MAQKPIAMEQLKQILQLNKDGVGIREMALRTGMIPGLVVNIVEE